MKRCYIVGAAPCDTISFVPKAGDLVIAADGGYIHCKRVGIVPNIVIGDFDSLQMQPMDCDVQMYPCEKDDTDMMHAIKYGLSKDYLHFHIFGGIGGRLDHTVANLQALAYLAKLGARGVLIDEPTCATVIGSTLSFDADMKGNVSIFSMDEKADGVTIEGLQYLLRDATLTNKFPLGVSNAFIGKESTISVRKGSLLIIWVKHI